LKNFRVHEEYDAVRVLCGEQNYLQICGKILKLFGEWAESAYGENA
jgi:hypothetical protein